MIKSPVQQMDTVFIVLNIYLAGKFYLLNSDDIIKSQNHRVTNGGSVWKCLYHFPDEPVTVPCNNEHMVSSSQSALPALCGSNFLSCHIDEDILSMCLYLFYLHMRSQAAGHRALSTFLR